MGSFGRLIADMLKRCSGVKLVLVENVHGLVIEMLLFTESGIFDGLTTEDVGVRTAR
jgi:hypothetical protein